MMKTLQGWYDSEAGSFDHYVNQFDEVDEAIYWHFLEVLPPIDCQAGFMVSEPYSYCEKYNTNTYGCYVQVAGKYYYLGNISPKAVSEKLTELRELLK